MRETAEAAAAATPICSKKVIRARISFRGGESRCEIRFASGARRTGEWRGGILLENCGRSGNIRAAFIAAFEKRRSYPLPPLLFPCRYHAKSVESYIRTRGARLTRRRKLFREMCRNEIPTFSPDFFLFYGSYVPGIVSPPASPRVAMAASVRIPCRTFSSCSNPAFVNRIFSLALRASP